MTPDAATVLDAVTQRYLTSGDFNGTPVREIEGDAVARDEVLRSLVGAGQATLVFEDDNPNPHVMALPPDDVDVQLSKLDASSNLEHVCLYPSAAHLREVVDRGPYATRPYTLRMALGEPSLTFVPFDLRVLETYRNDPRYYYETNEIQGTLGIRDKYFTSDQVTQRDKILLQHFGFGYNDAMSRCVIAMLYELARLSPEHQQIWGASELPAEYWPHPSFVGSVMGHWPEKESIFRAFTEELKCINDMSQRMGRPHLFRKTFTDGDKPRKFGFLIRPTATEFNDFALLLDKMLSDNIDVAFFQNEVPIEHHETRADGLVVARPKGSLTVFDDWLNSTMRFSDPSTKDQMIATLKKVRRLRQKPAHAINDDDFDQKYLEEQRQLVVDAYVAVRTIRLMFANHPAVKTYKVPGWLYNGDIWQY